MFQHLDCLDQSITKRIARVGKHCMYRWIYNILIFFSRMLAIPVFFLWNRSYSANKMIVIPKNELSRRELLADVTTDKKLLKSADCSGGHRLVIQTNSKSILVLAFYRTRLFLPHMIDAGASGLDLYQCGGNGNKWLTSITPANKFQMCMKRKVSLPSESDKYVLYLPLYAGLTKLNIISADGKDISLMDTGKNPIVVYGSSISQGCAASRSGLSYPNILSEFFNRDIINYGFSESARGQADIIDKLSQIDTDLIIMEYDHNADLRTLKNTHLNTYRIIRNNNLKALIVYMSRFSGSSCISVDELEERKRIIKATVDYANGLGDHRVGLILGDLSISENEKCFCDDRHPNDRGMAIIANEIISIVERMS